MLSGFWEEAEEPIARIDNETLLGFGESNTKSFDLKPICNWVFEEMKQDIVGVGKQLKLKLGWEAIAGWV